LAQIRRRDFALTSVVVMPRGTFANNRRREVEEQLGLVEDRTARRAPVAEAKDGTSERARESAGRFTGPLIVTEDYAEGWSRTFGAAETPATYLVNARGEFVWKHEGRLNPERLAAALDQHLLPSQQRPPLPLRLTVQPGDRAPDATFEDDHAQVLALRRLRGRPILLNFWQSWSAPCIKELRRLQHLHEVGGERGPVVVAVNGGEVRSVLAEARRQHTLGFPLIHDAGQRVARLYGVACWPTTVSINPDGIVDRIQFGMMHEHALPPRGNTAEAY
jgi:peroxiredoxin